MLCDSTHLSSLLLRLKSSAFFLLGLSSVLSVLVLLLLLGLFVASHGVVVPLLKE
jgi:hypothetical protein